MSEKEIRQRAWEKMKNQGTTVLIQDCMTVVKGVLGDMGGDNEFRLYKQEDGDIILELVNWQGEHITKESIEFCTPAMGGGRHAIVHKHLNNMIQELKEAKADGDLDSVSQMVKEAEEVQEDG